MNGMKGKSIIITGGASGIGRAAALLLGEAGCNVTIADLPSAPGDAVVAEIRKSGGEAQFAQTDVTQENDVRRMVESAVKTFGKLDGACNAAGLQSCSKLAHEISLAEWDRRIDVNLRGLFLCNKYEIEAMLKNGKGSIVNIASSGALAAFPRGSDYCAAKAGVTGFTRAAAIDYATLGIRINSVLPGGTLTPMLQQAMDTDPGLEPAIAAVHPMNRFAQPCEIGAAIRWLLSDEASFVTGISMPVDGGHTAI